MITTFKVIITTLMFSKTLSFQVPSVKNVGITPPFKGKFDPLGFTESVPDREFIRLRESELKHGRWAMISATSIPITELSTHKPAIHAFDNLPVPIQVFILFTIFVGEFNTMAIGYENPFVKGSPAAFKLKKTHQPGDMGLKIAESWDDNKFKDLGNKELNNGRLAMIASAGMILHELTTNTPIMFP